MADTHVPVRARGLPEQLWRSVEAADVVVHAGDWVSLALLEELRERSERLVAVYGNNDGDALRSQLPEVATATVEGLRFAVVHETGAAAGRERRCAARFDEADVLVFGHSHIPWDTTAASGLRLLNPGSPTDRRRQPFCTYMTASVRSGELREVSLVRLPLRTSAR
jgi:putative phosphoesterase